MNLQEHPCFNEEGRHRYGRVHLPVAPKCNIQCNYCDRKYDCVNESRPGITSIVISPEESMIYLEKLLALDPRIKVVGIAGPGDPFANPLETMRTLRMVRSKYPEMLLCLASNGLAIHDYIDELAALQVSHVTITLNTVQPEIASKIYRWVQYNKKVYRGIDAAALLVEKQLSAVKLLSDKGILVKVNTIVIPGVNDAFLTETAEVVKSLGAIYMNAMPLYPNKGTEFENIQEPTAAEMIRFRKDLEPIIPQMTHCSRCRADACGLINEKMSIDNYSILKESIQEALAKGRKFVAVTSNEGFLVNQHLGEAEEVYIYENKDGRVSFVEKRQTPQKGGGELRWKQFVELLSDCQAVFSAGAGNGPIPYFNEKNIRIYLSEGFIDTVLEQYFKEGTLPVKMIKKTGCGLGAGCTGTGGGCG